MGLNQIMSKKDLIEMLSAEVKPIIIAIAGGVASGKTTLARQVVEDFSSKGIMAREITAEELARGTESPYNCQ